MSEPEAGAPGIGHAGMREQEPEQEGTHASAPDHASVGVHEPDQCSIHGELKPAQLDFAQKGTKELLDEAAIPRVVAPPSPLNSKLTQSDVAFKETGLRRKGDTGHRPQVQVPSVEAVCIGERGPDKLPQDDAVATPDDAVSPSMSIVFSETCGKRQESNPPLPAQLIKISELRPEGKPAVAIKATEERAITVAQLDALVAYLDRHCEQEHWTSSKPPAPDIHLETNTIDLYDVAHWVIKPATREDCCSYVELIAEAKQVPQWFVSHWWGEPVKRFVACLRAHLRDHRLLESCAYWVCAYANNQWQAGEEVGDDPAASSFRRAIDKSVGTVTVLDGTATTYTRIWCSYEIFVSLTTERDHDQPKYLYEVYTAVANLDAVGLTDGLAEVDNRFASNKNLREARFPFELLSAGLNTEVDKAESSVEADRIHILNAIAGLADLNAPPLASHENYDRLNRRLRGRFAITMFQALVRDRCAKALAGQIASGMSESGVAEMDLRLTDAKDKAFALGVLKSALPSCLSRFRVSCYHAEVGSVLGEGIADAIRALSGLSKLEICLADSKVGAGGAAALGNAIGGLRRLEDVELGLSSTDLGDEGAAVLGKAIGGLRHLGKLHLALDRNNLGPAGAMAAISGVEQLPALSALTLWLHGNGLGDEVGVALGKAIGCLRRLEKLCLDLNESSLGEAGVLGVMSGIEQASGLVELTLDFRCNGLGGTVGAALGQAVRGLRRLERVGLVLQKNCFGTAGALSIFSGLRGLPALLEIKVDLDSCGLDDGVAEPLADALRAMPAVTILSVDLEKNELTQEGKAKLQELKVELSERRERPIDTEVWL